MLIELSENEIGLLASLLRQSIRKTERQHLSGRAKFGDAWNPAHNIDRLAFLEGIYRKFGSDPAAIGNRKAG